MTQPPKYVVGIGASAGGLEAIEGFFDHMPENDEVTFIIAQHLSPDFPSMMSDLLAHHTSRSIMTAQNKMPLNPNVIYLIPASFEAQIENHCFKLRKLHRKLSPQPISTLFESLALAYGQFTIGIILSGTGADGASSMEAIAHHNGLTIAQTPDEAKFSDMPNNAIATQEVQRVLSVSDMPNAILEYMHQPTDFHKNIEQLKPAHQSQYQEIFHLLDQKFTTNFNAYKFGTVARRIQRRMRLLNIENLQAYVAYLSNDEAKLKTLYKDLLIGVTQFFRDPEAFAVLESEVIPALFTRAKKTQEIIRIWVNSCATGEEVYSIAILLKKYADQHHLPFSIKIFATDINPEFILRAKKGQYSYREIAQVPPDLLNQYFIKFPDYYEVIPEIKRQILFTKHNLLRDTPFTKMDLICCRNLLIYITPKEQQRITDLLRFNLNIGGFLFLGSSEGLTALEPDLMATNPLWKIYKKTKRSHFPLHGITLHSNVLVKDNPPATINHPSSSSLPLYAYNAILQDVVSAGFIIDTSYVLLHSIGKARELLILPEGIPSLILTKIIIDELKGTLIAALHQAKSNLMPVVYKNITIHQNSGKERAIKMAVHPIRDVNDKISYYWIRLDFSKAITGKSRPITLSGAQNSIHQHEIITALEEELSEARVLVQSSLESMETVNEEAQSANEELMASNEELQSTNEELQSVNEELNVVNLERSRKIDEVIQAKTDIDNLIHGAEICTIILNSNLEIRIFTPAIKKIFNLVSHDIGRSLENFKHNLKFDGLMKKTKEVLKSNKPYEMEVVNQKNHWYFLKIIPYYSSQHEAVTGVVITLTDIHTTKLLLQKKEEIEKDLRLALKTGLIGIWHCDLASKAFTYDDTIKNMYDLDTLSDMNHWHQFIDSIHRDDRKRIEEAFAATATKHESFEQNFRITRSDGNIRYISCSANIHHIPASEEHYLTGICWDMTEKYWLEEKIIDAEHLNLGLDAITDGWWDWDLISKETYLSPLLKRTLGYEDHELLNSMESYEQLMVPEDLQILRRKMEKYLASHSDQPMTQEIRFVHKTGRIVWILSRRKGVLDKQRKLIRLVGTLTDITALKENARSLEKLAYRDFLTQVSNRPAFSDALLRAIARANRKQGLLAVIYLDIDNFKKVNDQAGHDFGDAVLCEVATILKNASRAIDFLARLGGDEFGVLLEDIVDTEEVRNIATRYLSSFSEPLMVNNIKISLTVSIGIALYPEHGTTEQDILKHADKNMYLAKKRGKNQFVL